MRVEFSRAQGPDLENKMEAGCKARGRTARTHFHSVKRRSVWGEPSVCIDAAAPHARLCFVSVLLFLEMCLQSGVAGAERVTVTHPWPVPLQTKKASFNGNAVPTPLQTLRVEEDTSSFPMPSSESSEHSIGSHLDSWGSQMKSAQQAVHQQTHRGSHEFRSCSACGDKKVKQGIASGSLNGTWVAFFCKKCAPHLSVRQQGQVPVSLESSLISPALAEAIGANESSLTMLPLYKRCLRCRRFATYGIPGPYRRARHCKAHQTPSDKDVVHRRLCQHADGCTLRPSFGDPSDLLPRFCRKHTRGSAQVNIVHMRCRGPMPRGQRCLNPPKFGGPNDPSPTRCEQHREDHHQPVYEYDSSSSDTGSPTLESTLPTPESVPAPLHHRHTRYALEKNSPLVHTPSAPQLRHGATVELRDSLWWQEGGGVAEDGGSGGGGVSSLIAGRSAVAGGAVGSWFARVQRQAHLPRASVT